MTNTQPSPEATAIAADLRLIGLLLARTLRAIRANKLCRGADLIGKAQLVLDGVPHCAEAQRANQLIESIATIGYIRHAQAKTLLRIRHDAPALRAVR